MCYYVFVVFKQKTEYELLISDWSSDVCSSDLCQAETGANGRDLNAQCLSADFGFDEAIAGGVFHANVERLPIDDYLVRRNSDIMHHISNLYLPCRGRTEPFSQLTINAARAIRLR